MDELIIRELEQEKRDALYELYAASMDSTVWSCLQGYNGRVFVDDREDMKYTFILVGDFLFPSNVGDFNLEKAKEMLREMNKIRHLGDILIIPQSKDWKSSLKQIPKIKTVTRYAIQKKKINEFDANHLEKLTKRIGSEYQFKIINEEIAIRVLKEDWSRDFCSNFSSLNDYLAHGIGVVIMHGAEIICGASSYTAYNKGIEVEIATKEEYRRQGLATACGAKLVLLCMEEGLEVNWDAANLSSVRIAEILGFTFDREYTAYIWN